MGGTTICASVKTFKERMTSSLIASWSHSDASYSGDWNTCSSIGRVVKVADKYGKAAEAAFAKRYDDDPISKFSSWVYDLGVTGYEVWTAKPEKVNKSAPKYKTAFNIYGEMGQYLGDAPTLPEAKKKAAELTLKTGNSYISIKKEKKITSGTETVSAFKLVKKEYKSKPKSVKAGSVLREIHYYRVVGFASC